VWWAAGYRLAIVLGGSSAGPPRTYPRMPIRTFPVTRMSRLASTLMAVGVLQPTPESPPIVLAHSVAINIGRDYGHHSHPYGPPPSLRPPMLYRVGVA